MDILDLDGQTAPESTRGLFDPPPENTKWTKDVKRHSAIEFAAPTAADMEYEPPQRCRSMMMTSQGNNNGNGARASMHPRSALHTVCEEEVTMPLHRKHRSSAIFNNFPMGSSSPYKEPADEDYSYSRADALAEAEAKLTGAYHRPALEQQKHNRRLSEPGTRAYYRHSEAEFGQRRSLNNKRTSLQYEENTRPMHLSLDLGNQQNRRSSRSDWRASTSSNHSSYVWAPFTPTRVSFPREDPSAPPHRRALFFAHLPFSALVPRLKARQLVHGILRVNRRNRSDAYVFCEELNADIYICGSRDRNRALEGDVVAVKLVDVDRILREKQEKEYAKVARNNGQPIIRKPDEEDEKEIMFGGEEDVDKVRPKYCGVVVAIMERSQSQAFSGTLGLMRPSNKRSKKETESSNEDGGKESPRIIWFKPTDKRVPLIAIPVEQAPEGFLENSEAFENRLFLGSIKRWPITSLHPFGVLEDELGPARNLVVQFRAILVDNNFSIEPFADSVLRQLPPVPWVPSKEDLAYRQDFRGARTFTVDVTGDGNLDNAVSIEQISDCLYQVGFHVADVSAFVKPNTPLDKEAKARAVGVYLYETSPLWPDQLLRQCTDFVAEADRLAFSVVWKMDQNGQVMDVSFGKSIVRSQGILLTSHLQDILDGNGVPTHLGIQDKQKPDWEDSVHLLYSLAQSLKQARARNGTMFLRKPMLDLDIADDGRPQTVSTKQRMPADDIMDEFKILANSGVAQRISSHFPEHALLQSQAPPNERKLRELAGYLRGLGYTIDPSTAGTLQKTIDAIENEAAKTVITILALKTMSQAKFYCTGKFDINKYYHYGLNAPLYTEFTSPSRRYSDLIVHRQLEAALAGERRFYLESEIVQKIARHCNVKVQSAEHAREQSQHLFLSRYLALSGQTATTHEAIVVGVQEQAFDVIVPGLDLERRIHIINLPVDTSHYNEKDGVLHLYWKKGVATADAMVEQADSLQADVDDEEEDDLIVDASPTTSAPPSTTGEITDTIKHLSIKSVSSPPSADQCVLSKKSRPRSMSLRAIEGENPWTSQEECTIPDECRQVVRPFDYIRVVITSDPFKSPPLIRVLAANPFV